MTMILKYDRSSERHKLCQRDLSPATIIDAVIQNSPTTRTSVLILFLPETRHGQSTKSITKHQKVTKTNNRSYQRSHQEKETAVVFVSLTQQQYQKLMTNDDGEPEERVSIATQLEEWEYSGNGLARWLCGIIRELSRGSQSASNTHQSLYCERKEETIISITNDFWSIEFWNQLNVLVKLRRARWWYHRTIRKQVGSIKTDAWIINLITNKYVIHSEKAQL